jgi:hypothetical protein
MECIACKAGANQGLHFYFQVRDTEKSRSFTKRFLELLCVSLWSLGVTLRSLLAKDGPAS